MHRLLLMLSIGVLSGLGLPACAHRAQALAEIGIVDRITGEQLPIFWHQGERWVAGVPGRRYAVQISNRSGGRLLGVVSIDGVNAITGETAAWHQGGYVFMPWQKYEITGWRKSDERVAAFEFTALENAYAARTGRPDHVGAIGVAVFREARPVPLPEIVVGNDGGKQARAPNSSAPAPEAAESATARRSESDLLSQRQERFKLGTGHGRSETSVVTRTQFERASSRPDQIIVIRYDSRERLIAMGIIPQPAGPFHPRPDPFPATAGYVPDPPR